MTLVVPAQALAEAWAATPESGYPFLAALRDLAVIWVEPLDGDSAQTVGLLAGPRGLRPDGTAQAVAIARHRGWAVLTGDPDAVLALDPKVGFETLP